MILICKVYSDMKHTRKPVRRCNKCLLNLGDECWLYAYPRGQWRGQVCRAKEDDGAHAEYKLWLKDPVVMTRKELRRAAFNR